MKDKIETYIGFSVKSRKVVIGLDSIEKSKKKIYCILMCITVSENTEKEVLKLAQKYNLPLIKTIGKKLCEIAFIDNLKVLALTDKELAKAVVNNLTKEYSLILN